MADATGARGIIGGTPLLRVGKDQQEYPMLVGGSSPNALAVQSRDNWGAALPDRPA